MKIFLDTGSVNELKEVAAMGLLDGALDLRATTARRQRDEG